MYAIKLLCLAAVAAALAPLPASSAPKPAEAPAAEPGIADAIATLKRYSTTASPTVGQNGKTANLLLATTGERSQQVYLRAATFGPLKVNFRSVETFAARVKSPPDAKLLVRLMKENSVNYGSWTLKDAPDGGVYIMYVENLPVGATPETMRDVVNSVSRAGDKLESELMAKDEF